MKRLLPLLAGTLFALVTLELGLRIIGFASTLEARRPLRSGTPALTGTFAPPPMDPAAFRILCLGNSHTQGAGTDPYPLQLEQLLRKKYPGRTIQVINTGRGNWNSSEILENLPGFLSEYRPHVVFAMAGEPNYWNYRHYQKHTSAGRLYDSLRFLKVVRLIDLLQRFDPRQEPVDEKPGVPYPVKPWFEYPSLAMNWVAWLGANPQVNVPESDLRVAATALEKWLAHPEGSKRRRAWTTLVEIYLRLGDEASALRAARGSFAFGFYDHFLMATLHRHQPSGSAWKALREGLINRRPTELSPESIERFLAGEAKDPGETFARLVYEAAPGEPAPATYLARLHPKECARLLLQAWKENPEQTAFLDLPELKALPFADRMRVITQSRAPALTWNQGGKEGGEGELASKELAREQLSSFMDSLRNWVAADLRRMVEISRDFGAEVALQTYPPYRFSGAERWPDRTIRNTAAELRAPLVDVAKHLSSLYAAEGKEPFYQRAGAIRDDNHVNSRGNLEIAKLMLEELEKHGWLPK